MEPPRCSSRWCFPWRAAGAGGCDGGTSYPGLRRCRYTRHERPFFHTHNAIHAILREDGRWLDPGWFLFLWITFLGIPPKNVISINISYCNLSHVLVSIHDIIESLCIDNIDISTIMSIFLSLQSDKHKLVPFYCTLLAISIVIIQTDIKLKKQGIWLFNYQKIYIYIYKTKSEVIFCLQVNAIICYWNHFWYKIISSS